MNSKISRMEKHNEKINDKKNTKTINPLDSSVGDLELDRVLYLI
ncbi:MAG: hypothetical protein ACK52J_03725 [bacterium]